MLPGMAPAEVLRLQGQQGAVPGHGEADPGRELQPAHRDGPGRLQPGPVDAAAPTGRRPAAPPSPWSRGLRPQRVPAPGRTGPGGPTSRPARDRGCPATVHHPDPVGQPLGGAEPTKTVSCLGARYSSRSQQTRSIPPLRWTCGNTTATSGPLMPTHGSAHPGSAPTGGGRRAGRFVRTDDHSGMIGEALRSPVTRRSGPTRARAAAVRHRGSTGGRP